jgi:hypothetical protein
MEPIPKNQQKTELKTLLESTCNSINKVNELRDKFNIHDDLFKNLLKTDTTTGTLSVRENFNEIYNQSIKKHETLE